MKTVRIQMLAVWIDWSLTNVLYIFLYVYSALNSTSQFLISHLLSADVFPNVSTIDVHLLDLDGDEEELHQLKNELEHQALHLLHQVQQFG